uniref:Beta C1 protein n=1 Tax=Cotton leaf curl betasatellite TaxID=134386 RepID=H6WCZ1_9VIRU|nr:beta C1 protein [Cotton leaf curl betasatellite]
MTIKYTHEKRMVITVDVKIPEDNSILVRNELYSTRWPVKAKKSFMIPYGPEGIITPFDLNNSAEGIHHMLKFMYRVCHVRDFRQEDMVEAIDIMMMHEAPLVGIWIGDEYDVCTTVCV